VAETRAVIEIRTSVRAIKVDVAANSHLFSFG